MNNVMMEIRYQEMGAQLHAPLSLAITVRVQTQLKAHVMYDVATVSKCQHEKHVTMATKITMMDARLTVRHLRTTLCVHHLTCH